MANDTLYADWPLDLISTAKYETEKVSEPLIATYGAYKFFHAKRFVIPAHATLLMMPVADQWFRRSHFAYGATAQHYDSWLQ